MLSGVYRELLGSPYHMCAVDMLGTISCWGDDADGQVSLAPSGTGHASGGGGNFHTCTLDSGGGVECWGLQHSTSSDYGQVSDAPTATGFTALEAGNIHNCAFNDAADIQCWGYDGLGQVSGAP